MVVTFHRSLLMWNSPFPFFTGPLSYWGMTLFSDSIPVWFGVHLLPPPVPGWEGCGHQPGSQVLRYSAFSVTFLPTSLNHSQRSFFLPLPLPSSLSLTCLCSFAYWLENLVSHSGCGSTAPWADSPGTGYAYTLELDRRPQPNSESCSQMPLGRSLMWYQDSDVELLAAGQKKTEMSAWHQMGTGLASWRFSVSFVPTDGTWARPVGKVGGEVKLSISYKNNKLFIMVMHIRGLVSAYTVLIWIFIFLLVLFWLIRPFLPPSRESNHKDYWMNTQWACYCARPMVWPSNTRHSFLLPVVFGK